MFERDDLYTFCEIAQQFLLFRITTFVKLIEGSKEKLHLPSTKLRETFTVFLLSITYKTMNGILIQGVREKSLFDYSKNFYDTRNFEENSKLYENFMKF